MVSFQAKFDQVVKLLRCPAVLPPISIFCRNFLFLHNALLAALLASHSLPLFLFLNSPQVTLFKVVGLCQDIQERFHIKTSTNAALDLRAIIH